VSTASSRLDLAELERPALEAALEERGHQRFHAGQILRWIYRRGVTDPAAMTDLSRDLRTALAAGFTISTPEVVQRETSIDGTEKFLLRLADGRTIE
jgi:23S rRNA (adenine2503-C2)-methyltransferase